MKSLEVEIQYLEKQQSRTLGETSQKLSENTGKELNKYPASFKQIRSVVNHTAADKQIRLLGKAEKKFVEANKPKLGC